jgi:hypothetical protein
VTYKIRKNTKHLFLYRDLLEAGSVWKAKLKRIEKNNAKLYLVLDNKRDEKDCWGWITYERQVTMFFSFLLTKSKTKACKFSFKENISIDK